MGTCPGDGDEERGVPACRRWQSTFEPGLPHEERVAQCATCEGCGGKGPSNPEEAVAILEGSDAEELVGLIEQVVCEQQAGRRFEPDEMDDLLWRGLVEWHRHLDAYRRAHEVRLKQMFEIQMAQLRTRM